MPTTTTTHKNLSSGTVIEAMQTIPDQATILAQATMCGLPTAVANAAVSALCSGHVFAAVVSGKLASGKDTIADMVVDHYAQTGLAPVTMQTSGPMRAEYRRIIELVGYATSVEGAAERLHVAMDIPGDPALHLAGSLWPHTRDRDNLPNPDERTDLNRHLLQFHADHSRRSVDPDYWTHQFFAAVLGTVAMGQSVLLTGGRYPNEIGPAQALGMMTIRLAVSRDVQAQRLWGRDGLAPDPAALDDPNECALDGFVGYNLHVGNDNAPEPTVTTVVEHLDRHMAALALF